MSDTLELAFRPVASRFISLAVGGEGFGGGTPPAEVLTPGVGGPPSPLTKIGEEGAAFGTRGDGKTWAALGVMIAHAQRHYAEGGDLPTRWLGAADTFASHTAKTHETLTAPGWKGLWRLTEDGHVAIFRVAGAELVRLRLFGVEDQTGMDRLRAECHGLWFEEPAPSSVLVQSSGLSEAAWGLGITSCRLPSYRHPKIMTLNYPDADHWTWRRFVSEPMAGTWYVRIPPGERASAEQREEWARALSNRPDMLRRLLAGQPGSLMLGPQVAVGFDHETHVRPAPPMPDTPVWIGQDGGLTPTSILGQRVGGRVRIVASLASVDAGIRQHLKDLVLPWLGERIPRALQDPEMVRVWYDPSLDTDSQADVETNPVRVMRSLLPGRYHPGPVSWEARKNALLGALGGHNLDVDPSCRGLIRALDGGWYYPMGADGRVSKADTAQGSAQPKKPNHPHEDFGDAFCYLLCGLSPSAVPRDPRRHERPTKTDFDVYQVNQPKKTSRSIFSLWGKG